jgi:hypothetical protein
MGSRPRCIPFGGIRTNPPGGGGIRGARPFALIMMISHRPLSGCDGRHILGNCSALGLARDAKDFLNTPDNGRDLGILFEKPL